ncbi:MAG: UbiA family prenyltransferase [Cyanobacteriota bacterium]
MTTVDEKTRSIFYRFFKYQKERFSFIQNGMLIAAFTFSAASYSRICRGHDTFIPVDIFVIGFITSFIFFFLLRIFDEFKDFEKDSKYQPYRAVPRGLVSLKELAWLATGLIGLQLIINVFFMPVMLIAYTIVMAYMALMTKEFFVKSWLCNHPMAYMVSHMMIMPLIDFYTTGLDWLNSDVSPPSGLIYFLAVTFFNGIIIETGRKIRAPEAEEEGVETYSSIFGAKKATFIWMGVLVVTFCFALKAAHSAGFGWPAFLILFIIKIICVIPAFRFLKTRENRFAKQIELSSGIWTIGMYLTLGGIPMFIFLLLS